MKEKQLLDYLIAQAKRSGTNTNSREFKEKVLRAKEYISKRQDYLLQQENIKKTAEVMAAEIAKIKISVPEVNVPEIKIPEIKIPDITGLEELKKELQKDLTVKGVEEIESDILGILSVTEKIMQAFDKPIPVVLVSPGGKEYEAQGSGGGVTGDLAKEKTLKDIKTATEATESTLEDIKDKVTEDVAKTITYNLDGTIATIVKVVGGVTYTKTFSYTSGNVTGISEWVAS